MKTASTASQTQSNEWEEVTTETGEQYWFNSKTNETTWDNPNKPLNQSSNNITEDEWEEFVSEDGSLYW